MLKTILCTLSALSLFCIYSMQECHKSIHPNKIYTIKNNKTCIVGYDNNKNVWIFYTKKEDAGNFAVYTPYYAQLCTNDDNSQQMNVFEAISTIQYLADEKVIEFLDGSELKFNYETCTETQLCDFNKSIETLYERKLLDII